MNSFEIITFRIEYISYVYSSKPCKTIYTKSVLFLQMYAFGIIGENLSIRIKGKLFEAILNMEMGWFDKKENGVGALCARLSSDSSEIQGVSLQRII